MLRDDEMMARAEQIRAAVQEASLGCAEGQLPAIWDVFFDLAEDSRFIAQCEWSEDEAMTPVLKAFGRRLFRSNPVRHLARYVHPTTGVRHGVSRVCGRYTLWFWFPVDGMGLTAVHRHDGAVTYGVVTRLVEGSPLLLAEA